MDALQVLRVSATYLRDELGLDPSPELERLEEQILRHDPALGRQPAVAIDDVVVLVIEIIGAAALARAAGANWGAARVGFGALD